MKGKKEKQLGLFVRRELTPEAERLLGNFEVVAGASGGVAVLRLRQTILELAVQGRISAPHAEDEPVALTLERILDERLKAGMAKPSPPVDEGEKAPFPIPSSWCWVRWGQLALFTSSGWSPQCENRPRNDGEWGVLKVSAVSWSVFKPDENKTLPRGVDPRPEFSVRSGDFLMSRANTAELVGRSVIVHDAPSRLLLSDKIVRCEFSSWVEKRFINLYNRTSAARAHYIANASGTSDSMKNISRDVILSMPVPLPPLAEQKRIVAKVDHLLSLCDALEAKLRRAEESARKLADALVAELLA